MPLIEKKIAPFNLKYFYDTLKYYGFTEKEIKYMTKIYNNGSYKQKDYMLGNYGAIPELSANSLWGGNDNV